MPIKKLYLEQKWYHKVAKVFFLILPLLVAVFLFFGGYFNIIVTLIENIIYVVIGLILYYIIFSRINRKFHKVKNSLSSNAPYAGEAGVVSALGNRIYGLNTQDFFPVVFSPEEINIRAYSDPDESLATYKTFDFDYTNKTNPLLEKELFGGLGKILQSRGLTRVEKNPQIIISMDFFIGRKDQYTPPQTVTSTEIKYAWNIATLGGSWGGFSSAVPVTSSSTIPGYTTTTYYSNIRLNFLNHAKLVKGEKLEAPPFIWIGEADNEGINSDIRGIARIMFSELMGEFPVNSASSSKRYVQRICYSGLGLGFDTTDWRVVRYVEPFSVAAEHGIKPGDVIVKVNGNQTVIDWAGRDAHYLKNPGAYRSRDPYFQYVLSNHNNSDVELMIKSVETGKMVKIEMKPRSEDLYLHVDMVHSLQKIARANPIGILFVVFSTAIAIYYIFIK